MNDLNFCPGCGRLLSDEDDILCADCESAYDDVLMDTAELPLDEEFEDYF